MHRYPAAPPQRRASSLRWIALGCSLLVLLGICGVVAITVTLAFALGGTPTPVP